MAGHSGGEDELLLIRQYGVLAYREADNGDPRLLLITSRETRRWVVPRGNPIFGLPPHLSAAREAWEEAGIVGVVAPKPLGTYRYIKRRNDGSEVRAKVYVFPLEVDVEEEEWPERMERERRWFSLEEAEALVQEPELKTLIRKFRLD
ncbi:NUDIX hydrolase [Sphingomonas sp. LY54]|uniref:NUDIX hydrolase n=1 Tax=Sphingomonadales TaxID=204457 RepID=UPI002ADED450|nr:MULTISPECIES: NUDIX hydrolase [Sphingomonadales]MEA1015772.1 NUDIX hydrolase [Sphingosinicella sp. LY1275]WRP28095.1 NUDIX hydrolase [Sphingomonas sp. LY54]